MSHPLESIPVLTDIVEDTPAAAQALDPDTLGLGDLEARLTAAIHDRVEGLVHAACRDMEALLLEQVADRLRAELPALVACVMDEHFQGASRAG